MVGLFVGALFASSVLLFWVQPMVAKMILPFLGGAPMVWNTCMVFFQTMLLAGYAYAHYLTTRFTVRFQTRFHLALILATVAALPIGLTTATAHAAPWRANPFVWLLGALFTTVALPFFTLSASAPLLQSWFSRTGHRSAADPYFLYAASNLGSLIGLFGYPAVMEPDFRLQTQTRVWAGIYGLLIVLFSGCALSVARRGKATAAAADAGNQAPAKRRPAIAAGEVTWRRRLRWVLWAFIPSSLMLGVTTYLSTDIASVPLLWVVPLGIYLLTFILVFARRQVVPLSWLARLLPPMAVFLVFVLLVNADNLAWMQVGLHLGFFFLAAMFWHTRLANDRPPARRLTEFYFCLAVGGVLGGLFNALLAPMLFTAVIEYPLLIVLACVRWPDPGEGFLTTRHPWKGLTLPAGIGLLTAVLAFSVPDLESNLQLRTAIIFGLPLILCYVASKQRQPLAFALALGALLLASNCYTAVQGRTLWRERNFFGTLRIALGPGGRMRRLYHGTTVHGMQFIDPARQNEPLAYYHLHGPCGQLMQVFNARPGATHVAVIGLGAGSMACYARAGQRWTFYEIDPAVIRVARDTNYFTYLARCTNAVVTMKVGDARLRLREAAAHHYDLLVCDAFGSDAPPLHLLDREAMELYLSKLAPHGLLFFHVSSRYLDFRPVIGNLAAYFGLQALVNKEEEAVSPETLQEGRLPSTWVALARQPQDLGPLRRDPRWQRLASNPAMRLWTDDYSDILGIFDWR